MLNTITESYYQTKQIFPELTSTNTDNFRELLPNDTLFCELFKSNNLGELKPNNKGQIFQNSYQKVLKL